MRTATTDLIGQTLSVLCVIHCAATPIVLAVAPAAMGAFGHAHPVLLIAVLATAAMSFIPGYRHHRQTTPLLLGLGGVTLLTLGTTLFHESLALDTAFSVSGAALMLAAHWKNRTAHRHCHACEA
ncbi:MAG: MerC domain-containing protein [Archangiaceae bacterium]|nr:MerC domain-containing protein [Archangiaceae bacterium]